MLWQPCTQMQTTTRKARPASSRRIASTSHDRFGQIRGLTLSDKEPGTLDACVQPLWAATRLCDQFDELRRTGLSGTPGPPPGAARTRTDDSVSWATMYNI